MNDVKTPAHLAVYVEILGTMGAIDFLLTFGGAELYIPQRPGPNSELSRSLGLPKAQALASVAERIPARIPTGKPWIARVLAHRGLSQAEIARRLHVSDVTVRKYLASDIGSMPSSPDQPSLF